jgi:hypothetical protein
MKARALAAGATTAIFLMLSAHAAEDPHHPTGDAATPPAAAQQPPAAGTAQTGRGQGMGQGMMGQGMMGQGMMGGQGMMSMMNMMGMMRAGGDDMPGMGMVDRVEGRIAFLQAELKITPAQAANWNLFATALRNTAQRLSGPRMALMGAANQTMAQRLAAQEQWLTARLEGTRALRTAYTSLYASLSDAQKRTADELLTSHMGLMQMRGM